MSFVLKVHRQIQCKRCDYATYTMFFASNGENGTLYILLTEQMFALKIPLDIDAHEDTKQNQYTTMAEDRVYRIHVADNVNTTQFMHMVYQATELVFISYLSY